MTDLALVADNELAPTPCYHVLGPGQLCRKPCAPGAVRCAEHGGLEERRSAAQLVEAARQRVLLKLEERAEDLAEELIGLARDPDVDPKARLDAVNIAFKVLGLDRVQVQVQTMDVTPGKAARDARLLDLLERAGAPDRASAIRSALGVVETTAREA